MTTKNCSCCFSFRRPSLRKIESSPRDSQCKETCCCWFRRPGARSSPSANNSTIESSLGDSQCKETPLSSGAPKCAEAASSSNVIGERSVEAASSSSVNDPNKSDAINNILHQKNIVDADLDVLVDHISKLLKLIDEENRAHQKPSTGRKWNWPNSPDLKKLYDFLSSGIGFVSALKDIISGPVKEILNGIGHASLATTGLLVVVYTLERFEELSKNKEECLKILKEMCYVANLVKKFKESPKGSENIIRDATSLIVEGAIMCCAHMESSQWKKFFKASKDKDDLSDIREKLNGMYMKINSEVGFRILTSIESKGKSPLSKEYPKHAVGIDKSIDEVLDLLEIESAKNAVTVILHGFGGMGKTTLADAVFSTVGGCKYSEVRLFGDIDSKPDIIDLQKKILKHLMGPEEPVPDIAKHEDGRRVLERVLEKVQAFLYIDNVLDGVELKKLLPEDMGTAKNVRVLLTARDQNVKTACPRSSTEAKIYKMNGVHDQEAMLILKKEIKEESLTERQFNDIIEICGKIPLMLTLAAPFIGRASNKQEAFSTLMRQKDKWASEEFKEMRYAFAYDAIPDGCKDPFLDICSYFKGWKWEKVADIVGKDELEMLESRALVTQTTGGVASVHDVILSLARQKSKDVRLTFTSARELKRFIDGEGTEVIKGIKGIWLANNKDAWEISASTLAAMQYSLRVLHLGNLTKVEGNCNRIFKKLIFLEAKITHFLFQASNLEQVRYLSYQPKDLKLSKMPSTLKHMDLDGRLHSHIFQISSTDLERLGDLRTLRLMNFAKLENVPQELGYNLKHLQELYLSFCTTIKKLPESISKLKSLRILKMYCCLSLTELPKDFGSLSSLQELTLAYCKKLEHLPDSFVELSSLRVLDLRGCESLWKLPRLFNFCKLKVLVLKRCRNLRSINLFPGLVSESSLRYVDLSYCNDLKGELWFPALQNMRVLRRVEIVGSKMLCKVPYVKGRTLFNSQQDLSMSILQKEIIEKNILLEFDRLLEKDVHVSDLPSNTPILVICDLCPCPYDGFPWDLIEETIDDMQKDFKIIYVGPRSDMLPPKLEGAKLEKRIFVGRLPEACAFREIYEDRWYLRMEVGDGKSDEYRPSWRLLSDRELEEFVVGNCNKYRRLKQLVETSQESNIAQLVETSQESNIELLRELFAPEGDDTTPVFQQNAGSSQKNLIEPSEQKIVCGVDKLKGKTVFIEMRPAGLCYDIRFPDLREMYDVVKEKLHLEIISIPAVEPNEVLHANKQFSEEVPWFVYQNSWMVISRVVKFILAQQCGWEGDDTREERWHPSLNWIIHPNGRITTYKPSILNGRITTYKPSILNFLFDHLEGDQVKRLIFKGKLICLYSGISDRPVICSIKNVMEELKDGIHTIYIPNIGDITGFFTYKDPQNIQDMKKFWLTDTVDKNYYCPSRKTTGFCRCLIQINETTFSNHKQLCKLNSLSDYFPFDKMYKTFMENFRKEDGIMFMTFMDEDGNLIAACEEETMQFIFTKHREDGTKRLIKLMMMEFHRRGKETYDEDFSVSGGLTKNMQIAPAMDIDDVDSLSEYTFELLAEKQLHLLLKFDKGEKEWSREVTWPTAPRGLCMLKDFLSNGVHVDWVKDAISCQDPQQAEVEVDLAITVKNSLLESIEEASWAVAALLAIADVLKRIETVSNNQTDWLLILGEMYRLSQYIKQFNEKPGLWTEMSREATGFILLSSMACCSEIDPIKFALFGSGKVNRMILANNLRQELINKCDIMAEAIAKGLS